MSTQGAHCISMQPLSDTWNSFETTATQPPRRWIYHTTYWDIPCKLQELLYSSKNACSRAWSTTLESRCWVCTQYSKEMEIRQLLKFCTRISFVWFLHRFFSKIFDQNIPLLEGPIISWNGGAAKLPLQFTLYLPLLGGAYFGRIFRLQKSKQKSSKWNSGAEL